MSSKILAFLLEVEVFASFESIEADDVLLVLAAHQVDENVWQLEIRSRGLPAPFPAVRDSLARSPIRISSTLPVSRTNLLK